MGNSSRGKLGLGDDPALDAPPAAHEKNAGVSVPPAKFPRHGKAGKEMSAGAAAGHDQSHGWALRQETPRSIPATVK